VTAVPSLPLVSFLFVRKYEVAEEDVFLVFSLAYSLRCADVAPSTSIFSPLFLLFPPFLLFAFSVPFFLHCYLRVRSGRDGCIPHMPSLSHPISFHFTFALFLPIYLFWLVLVYSLFSSFIASTRPLLAG